jgi:hypothetical protein
MTFIQKLYYLIDGQLPDYVVDEYPVFVDFLRAYYKFLDTVGQANNRIFTATSWMDIDDTLDIFLPRFRAQYGQEFPENTVLQVRRLLKHIGEFYEGKGSEISTRLFFRMVFNTSATVTYPGEYILRTSDGIWRRRIIVKVDTRGFTGNVFDLKNTRFTVAYLEFIPGLGNVLRQLETQCVDVVKQIEPDIFQLQIDLSPLYQFPDAPIAPSTWGQLLNNSNTTPILPVGSDDTQIFVTSGTTVYGRLTRQLVRLKQIIFPGSNFRVDDSYIISETGVEGPYFAQQNYFLDKDTEASVESKPYFIETFDNNAVIRVNNITPRRQSVGVYFLDDTPYFLEEYFTSVSQLGAGIRSLQIVKTGQRFTEREFTIDVVPKKPRNENIPAGARLIFETGIIYHEPGQFKNASGFLSDINRLQDNYYYQPYSYVINSDQPFVAWKNTFLQTAHPAGFKLFANWISHNPMQINSNINDARNKFISRVFFETIQVDDTNAKNITKIIVDDYFSEIYFFEDYFKQYNSVSAIDTIASSPLLSSSLWADTDAGQQGIADGISLALTDGVLSGMLGYVDTQTLIRTMSVLNPPEE